MQHTFNVQASSCCASFDSTDNTNSASFLQQTRDEAHGVIRFELTDKLIS